MDKLLKKIEENFPKELKEKGNFWIYKNKVIVFDININGNKIAFDITLNFVDTNVKIEVFSRNMPESLNFFKENLLISKNGRYLILDEKLENINKVSEEIINSINLINKNTPSPIEELASKIENSIEKTKYFKKFWIYRNKTIALELNINGNNVVFSSIPDFKSKTLKIILWSRNYIDGLYIYDEKLKKIETGGYIVFDGRLEDVNQAIYTLNMYMYDIILKLVYTVDKANHNIVINRIKEKRKNQEKIKVGFFVSETSKWNSQNIYDYFATNLQYDSEIVVFSSSNELKYKDFFEENRKATLDFFQKCGKIRDAYSIEKNRHLTLQELGEYDVVFVQQQWGFSGLPFRLFGKTLVYFMSYGYTILFEPKMQCEISSFFPYLYRHYADNIYHKAYLENYQPNLVGQIKVVGYTKFDSLENMEEFTWKNNFDKKVIFAPHFSFAGKGIKLGTFEWSGKILEEFREYNKDITWLYKPHPRLSTAIEILMSLEEYKKYCNEWEESSNSTAKYDGEYLKAFDSSTTIITDCSSFLAEYMITGNPIIRLISKYDKGRLNDIGEKINQVCYRVQNEEELRRVFNDVVVLGKDPLKESRHALRDELFGDGFNASKRIIEDIEFSLEIKGIK